MAELFEHLAGTAAKQDLTCHLGIDEARANDESVAGSSPRGLDAKSGLILQ